MSIVVPIHGETPLIADFSRHLLSLEHSDKAQIIVVDGESNDGSQAIVRDFPVTLIEAQRGRARQMNVGVRICSSGQQFWDILTAVLGSSVPEQIEMTY